MATSGPKQGYRKSTLLTKEENEKVRGMLGEGCQGLATSVIQLFMTEPPEHKEWTKKDAGILCLERDHAKRSYFLRLYCLKRQCQVWEMELYKNMEYDSPKPFLHVFEGQDRVFALNFASETEAEQTYSIINAKLEKSKQKIANKEPRDVAGPSTSTEGEQETGAPETVQDAETGKEGQEAAAAEGDKAVGGGSPAVSAAEKTESPAATGAEPEPGGDAGGEEAPEDDAPASEVGVVPAEGEELAEPVAESRQKGQLVSAPQGGESEEPSLPSSITKDLDDAAAPPQEEVETTEPETLGSKQHSAFLGDPDDRPPTQNGDMTTLLAKAKEDKIAKEQKEKEAKEEMEKEGISLSKEELPAEGKATEGEESRPT